MDVIDTHAWSDALGLADETRARSVLANANVDVEPLELELAAHLWMAGRSLTLPDPAHVTSLKGQSAIGDMSLSSIAGVGVRAAVLAFDRATLEAWLVVHQLLCGSSRQAEARREIALAWSRLFSGHHDEAERCIERARTMVRDAELSSSVIELQWISALVSLGKKDFPQATAAARLGSRMAGTEARPADEIFSNLVLARVRRVTGATHLSLRIANALAPLASAPFRSWIEWERRMAGAQPRPFESHARPVERAIVARDQVIVRALAGDREGFDAAVNALRSESAGFSDLAIEAADLIAATDASSRVEATDAMRGWMLGEHHVLPHGLHGLAMSRASEETEGTPIGYAVAHRERRRVLTIGVPLLEASSGVLAPLHPSKRPQERTDAAIALLALRNGSIDETSFFKELYGFEYQPLLHGSILSSLLHRVRGVVGGCAMLHREHGRLRLEPHDILVAWDPRCYRPLEDRILRELALQGPNTAKNAAERLGVPLRTVQAALSELIEGGACRRERRGRNLEYLVEDTTFSEPTWTRARLWRGE